MVVGKRMSRFLASAGLLPITCPIRENPPMLSQVGPKLESLMMILCKAFFIYAFYYDGAQYFDKSNYGQFSPKNVLGQSSLQNYGALYFVMGMSINIRHIYAFQQNVKKVSCK